VNPGDWVIWHDLPGEIVTRYNDGLNLVIRVPYTNSIATQTLSKAHTYREEVISVESKDCTLITKEVADIMKADL
jgi:hypothetical protein